MKLFSWFLQANKDKAKNSSEKKLLSNNNIAINCNMWPIAVVRQPTIAKQALFVAIRENEKQKHERLKPIKMLSTLIK
jgi:hypothetical protein